MIDPQLDGKVVIVTGANHGIGAATAKSLAAQGAKVFITYHKVMDEISIEVLADHPEWVPIIAKWHWDEWGHLDPGGSLLKWTDSLAGRNNHDQIPMSLVAVENGNPIGSVTIEEHDMETRKDLTPWLAGVYIKPEFRSRGVGSQLIRSALETANRLEIDILYLYTHSASGLYAKLGWIELEKCQYQGREVTIMVNHIGT